MKIFGLAGRSGSGKTTLLVRLLPELRARGFTVSTLKHAHHGFDIDRPGKDSHRHREAGASEVMVVSGDRWALLHEIREEEPPLEDLIRRMTPVDLVLVEGFHTHGHPMIEVHRPSAGHRLMWHPGSDILAVASDEPVPGCGVPALDLNETVAIADFVMATVGLPAAAFDRGRDEPRGSEYPVTERIAAGELYYAFEVDNPAKNTASIRLSKAAGIEMARPNGRTEFNFDETVHPVAPESAA